MFEKSGSKEKNGLNVSRETVNGVYKMVFYASYDNGSFERAVLESYTATSSGSSQSTIQFTDSFGTMHSATVYNSWLNN